MTFVQIGEFDWLSGRQKGSIFVKIFKILPLRRMKMKLGILAKDIALYKTYVYETSTVSLEMIEFYFYRNVYWIVLHIS